MTLKYSKYSKLFGRDVIIPLINELNLDFSYYGLITIGGQNFTVDYDTGSPDLWVPGIQCSSSQCGTHNQFDPAKSSTFVPSQKNFTLSYGTGTVISGYEGRDIVILNGISVTNLTFGIALVDGFNTVYEEDGILGLSRQIGRVSNPGLIQKIKGKKVLNHTIIAFHFGRYKLKVTDKSFMNLGGIDVNAYIGNIVYNDLINQTRYPGTWMISLHDIQVDGISVGGINSSALIDTGTPTIIGDITQVSKIHTMIPGSYFNNNLWWIPCNTNKIVALVFNNTSYKISPTELIRSSNQSSSLCLSKIQGDRNGVWVVGAAFLSNVYSVFDFDNLKIGFAESKVF
ncbi:aspartic peptidase domain-containing protein [Gigaspora rosea]|uniref:Aspartic peptidase domain-containing protein n=1 Tax=Gigaspora rosea TaxID=44941 RepID=A0A397VFS9_9GLOM|nr:aspartic peptidase domain-containing protein [Gigaspora rosea]